MQIQMRKKAALSTCLVLLVLVAGLWALGAEAQDWAGRGRLQGMIKDPEGQPVEGAKITLTLNDKGPAPILTDKKGRWSMLGLATGNWTIVIEKEGFKTSEGAAKVISEGVGPTTPIQITLNYIPKEVAQAEQGPDPNAMIERGNALMLEQRWADARAEFQNAIAAIEDPTIHPAILRGISRTYHEEGNSAQALKTLQDILAVAPEDQETLKLVVTLLMADGKEEEAKTYQARIVGEFKVDPNSLLNLGIQHYNAGRIAEASTYFERVVAENPEQPEGYYYRALVYLNQGKNEEAKADLQKLLAIAPDHPKAAEAKEFLAVL